MASNSVQNDVDLTCECAKRNVEIYAHEREREHA